MLFLLTAGKIIELPGILLHIVEFLAAVLVTGLGPPLDTHRDTTAMD